MDVAPGGDGGTGAGGRRSVGAGLKALRVLAVRARTAGSKQDAGQLFWMQPPLECFPFISELKTSFISCKWGQRKKKANKEKRTEVRQRRRWRSRLEFQHRATPPDCVYTAADLLARALFLYYTACKE